MYFHAFMRHFFVWIEGGVSPIAAPYIVHYIVNSESEEASGWRERFRVNILGWVTELLRSESAEWFETANVQFHINPPVYDKYDKPDHDQEVTVVFSAFLPGWWEVSQLLEKYPVNKSLLIDDQWWNKTFVVPQWSRTWSRTLQPTGRCGTAVKPHFLSESGFRRLDSEALKHPWNTFTTRETSALSSL